MGLGPLQRTVVALSKIISLSGDLNFSSVIVGNSSNRTLTIANSGNSVLTVSSINYPAGFSGVWSGSVPAGGSHNVTVTFVPTEATNYGGTVTVNSNATSGTNTISASGTGSSAPTRIISLIGNLPFGNVHVGTTAQRTMTIANSGDSPLMISSINYPAGFSGSWSGSVPASGSQNVTVTFAPTEATNYGGTVTVNSDATSGTNTISASGTGMPEPPPDEFWKSPTATGIMHNEWTTPGNAYSSDDQRTTAQGQWLEQDYYNFDFVIPANAIINGIEVKVEGHGDNTGLEENRLIVDTWSASSDGWGVKNNGAGGWWFLGSSGTDAIATGGGSTDLWGQTWQASDFSNDNFKLRIQTFSNPDSLFVDHIQVRVYYTEPPPTYAVSGYVQTSAGSGISGVTMNGLPGNPTTNGDGYYSATVDYDWSGTVTPTQSGYIFDPPNRPYTNVTADQTAQNYAGTPEIVGDFCGPNFDPPDGYVDVWDLMQFAEHWHTRFGDPDWDSKSDLAGPNFGNPDGYVDVWDLMVFADHWHEGVKP